MARPDQAIGRLSSLYPALLRALTAGTLTAGALNAACAGSGPDPVAKPATTSAPASAPRNLARAPVVLGPLVPSPVPGVDWAWLLPDARATTLLQADAQGRRVVVGPAFFAGANGAAMALDSRHVLQLVAGGAVHELGKFTLAAFDAKAESALAWGAEGWGLFSRTGEKRPLPEVPDALPLIFPSGLVLLRATSRSVLVRPPAEVLHDEPRFCGHLFPAARRLVCLDGTALTVISLDTGAVVARIEGAGGTFDSQFAMRPDGGALAWGTYDLWIADLLPEGDKPQPRLVAHLLPAVTKGGDPGYSHWIPRRLGFSQDGAHLCTVSTGAARIHALTPPGSAPPSSSAPLPSSNAPPRSSSAPPPPRMQDVCMFAPAPPGPSGPLIGNNHEEWQPLLLRLPVHDRLELVAPEWEEKGLPSTWDVSLDRGTAIYLEERYEGSQWTLQAVVIDPKTSAVRRLMPMGEVALPAERPGSPTVELSADGKLARVCAALLFAERCRNFDTESGAPSPAQWTRPPSDFPANAYTWVGEMPEAHIAQVAAVLTTKSARVTSPASWRDEGSYVSIDLDAGKGATLHLNVPDRPGVEAVDAAAVGTGMVAIAAEGSVALWSAEPLALRALLMPARGGVAVLYPDGTFETTGNAEEAMRCQEGEVIMPLAACADSRVPAGTLARMVDEAASAKR